MRNLALLLVLVLLSACRVARPSEIPHDQDWIVAVKSCGIPQSMPWYSRFAEHTWIDMKYGSEMDWTRAEVEGKFRGATVEPITSYEARRDLRWSDESVRVHAVFIGQEARQIREDVCRLTGQLKARYANGGYEAWPGPNSNTFLRELTQEVPQLAFAFDHNAVGKDYTWFDAGLSPSRTGVHFDTWPIGATLAAKEGLELHLLQLTFGLSFWPPHLKLPFLPAIPWERAPEPRATSRAPVDGEQVIVYPFEDADSASEPTKFEMVSSIQPPITSGRSLRIESSTAHSWVSVVFKLAPSADPAVLHSVRAETVVHWMGSTDLVFAFDLRRDGSVERVGPFALDGAIVLIQLRAMPDGTVETLVSVNSR